MRVRSVFVLSLFAATSLAACSIAQTQAAATSAEERAALHSGPDWAIIAPHLPNPQTASAAQLENAGDVLRARRFPEDALDYYGYALARGGNMAELLNRMGVVRLELRQNDIAQQLFQRVVREKKNDAQAWNNLGVAEFANRNFSSAIAAYKRATRLDGHSAIYHSNLAMAYFDNKQPDSARTQLALAIKLDPSIMQARDGGGPTAHVMGTENYGDLCFEMAKLYARDHNAEEARRWLAKASEGGFDVRAAMGEDPVLAPYLRDPEVKMMLTNAAQMRKRTVAAAPGLGEAAPVPGSTAPRFIAN
jgi:tetratricopeptide (TPR) repeat protein